MRILFFVCLAGLLAMSCTKQKPAGNFHEESIEAYQERMAWFKEARYGMFIHFGLYSQLGGVWKGDTVRKYSEWIQSYKDISKEEYAPLIKTFNPQDFDADLIVRTAKDAGMKYLVITSKHHEGFCLWESKYTDFDLSGAPFDRDVLRELADACKKHGVRFGTYYSIIDWHHPTQQPNLDKENHWERWGKISMVEGKKEEYVRYMKNQLKEILDNYDPGILWFDGDWADWWTLEDGIDLYNYLRGINPELIINNRVAKRDEFLRDYGTPEQFHIDSLVNFEWEACYTLNTSWGFKHGDNNWKQPTEVYEKLIEINKFGGNFLLNIGPDGSGRVPEESIRILLEVGEMLKKR
jgi:alpha-L-fucosidase